MRLTYKRITENDWKTVASIEQAVDDGRIFKAFIDENDSKEYLRKSIVYLVLLQGEPIGTISYELKDQDHAYIDSMTIIPKYQGKGYATEAFEWLLLQLQKMKRVDLVTHPQNTKALLIYLKHGFVIDSWINNYFGDGEARIKLVLVK